MCLSPINILSSCGLIRQLRLALEPISEVPWKHWDIKQLWIHTKLYHSALKKKKKKKLLEMHLKILNLKKIQEVLIKNI